MTDFEYQHQMRWLRVPAPASGTGTPELFVNLADTLMLLDSSDGANALREQLERLLLRDERGELRPGGQIVF